MRAICSLAIFLGLLLSAGCDELAPPAPQATETAQPESSSSDASGTGAGNANDANDDSDAAYEREVVSVGADKRGRNYGGGVITEPIRQYFRAGQRINLLNLKRAMDLYKAANNNKLPATHEQFMKEIVEANGIELPELPAGERYVFDPERGELMVERPK